MKFFKSIAAGAAVSGLAMLASCSSSEDDSLSQEDLVAGASPILVNDAEFYAARYSFTFVTRKGQLMKITPLSGGNIGTEISGTLSVGGVSTPVGLEYELQGDFNDLGNAGGEIEGDAIGALRVNFTDLGASALALFEELGVTFTGAVEDEAYQLPANSGFIINVVYLNPEGADGNAIVLGFAPLEDELASWITTQQVANNNTRLQSWLENELLLGAYKIERIINSL